MNTNPCPDCERLRRYIALLEEAVEYARNQQDREFLLLLPELDFTRLTVMEPESHK